MAFKAQTVSRLLATLRGFIPIATFALILSGLLGGHKMIGGSTLSVMGLVLGAVVGLPLGHWLNDKLATESDRRLPLVLSMVFLPLAMLPSQSGIPGFYHFGFHGWLPVMSGVLLAFPLGVANGCSWSLHVTLEAGKNPISGSFWSWTAAGAALGALIALGSVLVFSVFGGAFLVNLFMAPLVWPSLPQTGDRSLLVRMILTMVVVLSTMFLLFT